jgi:hypothetical protein
MKVLITGSTSPQASVKTATRTPTFASLLSHSFISQGISAELVEPSTELTTEKLDKYDAIFVGIAPPTSLSANRVYPAFAVANRARHLGKLVLFIDAPEPYKIQASLKSCYLNISDLQKNFYWRRKSFHEFTETVEFQEEVYQFIEFLYTEEWPTLLYPAFPWFPQELISKALPNATNSVPVNLDETLIQVGRISPDLEADRTYWTCDAPRTKWAAKVSNTLALPVMSTRKSRWDLEDITLTRMRRGVGTLISLYRSDEPWWSPALSQSLSQGVPVVTDWRFSQALGAEWSYLPSSVESMSTPERFELAVSQRDFYLGSISTWQMDFSEIRKNKEPTLV